MCMCVKESIWMIMGFLRFLFLINGGNDDCDIDNSKEGGDNYGSNYNFLV